MGYGDAAVGYQAPDQGYDGARMAHGGYAAQAPRQQPLKQARMPVAGPTYQQYAPAAQGMAWGPYAQAHPAGQARSQDPRLVRAMG